MLVVSRSTVGRRRGGAGAGGFMSRSIVGRSSLSGEVRVTLYVEQPAMRPFFEMIMPLIFATVGMWFNCV